MPAADKPDQPRLLTAEDIVAVDDVPTETVDVPEWGGSVVLRGLTLEEVLALRGDAEGAAKDPTALSVKMLTASFADPVLTPEQAAVLVKKSATVVARLMQKASRLSGVDEEAVQRSERAFRPSTE